MLKQVFWIGVLVIVLTLISQDADAQCVMCKAVADDLSNENQNAGSGINKGILYIMAVPYLCLSFLGLYFFGPKKIKLFLRNLVGAA
ncbi:MAG: hypothetical protein ACJAY8_000139 [Sphingobacteriales bacterium]|jgi:hypothetical protein